MCHLDIQTFPTSTLLSYAAQLLQSVVATNDQLKTTLITRFHSRSVPNVTIHSYLKRILTFAPFTNDVLLAVLMYFDRISTRHEHFVISSLNVHRLLITSIMIAAKFHSDVFYSNQRYAKVGGLPLQELNQLELEFLFLCDFDLLILPDHLQVYADQLLTHSMNQIPHSTTCQREVVPEIPVSWRDTATSSIPHRSSKMTIPLTPPYDPTAPALERQTENSTKSSNVQWQQGLLL